MFLFLFFNHLFFTKNTPSLEFILKLEVCEFYDKDSLNFSISINKSSCELILENAAASFNNN